MKKLYLKILVFFVVLLLVLNIVLFSLNIINYFIFWFIIILAAFFAYKVLPKRLG